MSHIPARLENEIHLLFDTPLRASRITDRGLSTAMVFRLENPASGYALKRWPITFDQQRLRRIHDFQQYLAQRDILCTPKLVSWSNGDTLLKLDGACWEIAEWKPGEPIAGIGKVNDDQLLQLMERLAEIHDRSRDYATDLCVPPGIADRYANLVHASQVIEDKRRQFVESICNLREFSDLQVLKDLFLRAMRVVVACIEPLQQLAAKTATCFWVLRDVRREHVLYCRNAVFGIIDFGAARIDWPGLDLVRSLGTMMLDSDPRWPDAVAHYLRCRPDSSIDVMRVKQVHRASVALSALQWIDWFADGEFDWTDHSSHAWARVMELYEHLVDLGGDASLSRP